MITKIHTKIKFKSSIQTKVEIKMFGYIIAEKKSWLHNIYKSDKLVTFYGNYCLANHNVFCNILCDFSLPTNRSQS